MNPISVAIKGKGLFNFLWRGVSIARHYGLTPAKMDRALAQFIAVLRRFGCGATFPITSIALSRSSQVIRKYKGQGIEFAIHGYRHVDHCQLSLAEQLDHLESARELFSRVGIRVKGFRGPYLHANSDTLVALRRQDLIYDSSQGIAWDVLDGQETPDYLHVLSFYGALSANDYPSLPDLDKGLVRIPYSLPDDEALAERLDLTAREMEALWLAILRRAYELGELFTLGLHPERIAICKDPLEAVLTEARRLRPAVWITCLDEIAAWWCARAEAVVVASDATDAQIRLTVAAPQGTVVLARGVGIDVPAVPWAKGYRRVEAATFAIQSPCRPFIGLSPGASPNLAEFLRQQGHIVEISEESDRYSYYFDQAEFTADHKRPLLDLVEGSDRPLVRLGRWPNGARSALAITGDIDALTLWDYGLRFLGR